MKPEIEKKYKKDFLVLLTEEYGYRNWFWFPNVSSDELIIWWSKLESIEPYFMTPEPLLGNLYQVKEDDEFELFMKLEKSFKFYTAHIHCDDDSVLIKPDKTKIYHKGYNSN